MTEQQKYWFAARTRDKQEFTVRKSLDRLKSEEDLDLDYYLPTRFVISQLKYRRKRSEVPVIRNLVFVHSTKQTACDISNIYNVPLFYMKDFSTHSMLVVPDKQMEDFMIRFKQMEEEKIHPVLIAAYLHDELVRIHPFIDGNGRTSRLLMNLYLLRNGYVIITLKGSNDAKVSYYMALEKSHTEDLPEDFQKLVVEAEIAALQKYLSIMA